MESVGPERHCATVTSMTYLNIQFLRQNKHSASLYVVRSANRGQLIQHSQPTKCTIFRLKYLHCITIQRTPTCFSPQGTRIIPHYTYQLVNVVCENNRFLFGIIKKDTDTMVGDKIWGNFYVRTGCTCSHHWVLMG